MATESNKRRFERVRISASKSIWNLSEGGAFVATTTPRRLGSVIHFEFRLWPDEPPFRALAKVVRVLHKPNPKINEPAGMGIQFTQVSDDDRIRLRAYLSEQKKMREKRELITG